MKIYKTQKTKPLIKVLVYGKQGAGKTMFAATAQDHPDMKDVLVVNVEGGLLTVADKELAVVDVGRDDAGKPNGKILADLESVAWNILSRQPGWENFKTVIIDSITELQARDIEDVVRESVTKNKDRKGGQDDIFQEDYGKDTARMRRIFRMLRDAPINLICTALPKSILPKGSSSDSAPVEVRPSMTAGVADSVMGMVDFVWLLYKDEKTGKRKLLTEEKGIYRAKTRNPKYAELIGSVVDEPNMPDLYNKLIKAME